MYILNIPHAKVTRAQIFNWVTCRFQCMVVWQKVGTILGERGGRFWAKSKSDFGQVSGWF
jgi:hypothetical protein